MMKETISQISSSPCEPSSRIEDGSRASAVFRKASTMAADGRFRDAIAYATKENLTLRMPELERELLRWRHSAFALRDVRRPVAVWPSASTDLFADAVGLVPEIAAGQFTAQIVASGILHHGCLIVRGLVSESAVAALADGVASVFSAIEAARKAEPSPYVSSFFSPFESSDVNLASRRAAVQKGGAAVWAADSPRIFFNLVEAFEHWRIIDVVAECLGERPVLSVQKTTLRMVPPTTGTDWHQDGAFLGANIRAVNVWLSLSDCGEDAPGLDLLPRRVPYIVEKGTRGAFFDWSVGADTVRTVARGTPIVRPVFRPGDAIIFDQLFLHRTGVGPQMTKTRCAIESWFFAPSTMPTGYHGLVL